MDGRGLARQVLRQERRRVVLSSALFVSHQIGEVLVPVVAGLAIDRGVVTGDSEALVRWLFALVVVFAVLSTSWRLGDRLVTAAMEESAHRLRLRITDRLVDHRGVQGGPAAGEAVSIATSDVASAVRVMVAVGAAAASIVALIAAAIILLVLSRPLGLIVLIGLPLVVVVLNVASRPLERRAGDQREEAARAASLATDLLTGLRSVQGMRAQATASHRYRAASQRSLTASLWSARLGSAHEGATVLVSGLVVAAVTLVAGRLAADGDLTVGGLVAAVGVTQFLVGPLWRIGFAAGQWARSRASANRVAELLDRPPLVLDGSGELPNGAGRVALRQVSHGGLNGIDLDVAAGAFVAVASSDPADGQTMVDLLARRTDPTGGRLEIDGTAFDHLSIEHLRRTVVVAPHDAALFAGTVMANVVGSLTSPAEERALGAIAAAGGDEMEQTLPAGVHTEVGGRGLSLSGGQRQRVALARALMADGPVLVLHDPTTSVDPVTEQRAATGLRSWREGRTTIVVTNSPALLAVADEVVVIEAGRITERGRHVDLVAGRSNYASMVLS